MCYTLTLCLSLSVSPVVFPEASLTPKNLSAVLDITSDDEWQLFGRYINTPESELQRIRRRCTSGREFKQALIYSFVSSHPAPSWTLVARALYETGYGDDSFHRALDLLQQLFLTGTFIVFKIYRLGVGMYTHNALHQPTVLVVIHLHLVLSCAQCTYVYTLHTMK